MLSFWLWLIFIADRHPSRTWPPGFRGDFGASERVCEVSQMKTEVAEERITLEIRLAGRPPAAERRVSLSERRSKPG